MALRHWCLAPTCSRTSRYCQHHSKLALVASVPLQGSQFGEKRVQAITFHDSGKLIINFGDDINHSESCDRKTSYILPASHPYFNQIYSGLLAAMHSKAPVNGWVNGCVDIWGKGYVKIIRVDFLPNS